MKWTCVTYKSETGEKLWKGDPSPGPRRNERWGDHGSQGPDQFRLPDWVDHSCGVVGVKPCCSVSYITSM